MLYMGKADNVKIRIGATTIQKAQLKSDDNQWEGFSWKAGEFRIILCCMQPRQIDHV